LVATPSRILTRTDICPGNLLELHHGQAGEVDFKWNSCYGDIVRFKGIFGVGQLVIDIRTYSNRYGLFQWTAGEPPLGFRSKGIAMDIEYLCTMV
jgi:hypothetical protein